MPMPCGSMHQDRVPGADCSSVGRAFPRLGYTPLRRPASTGGVPTAERTATGPERTDVKQRARRFFLPTAMVAGAAALILTTTVQAAPVAQADEVAHAAGFNANLTWSTDAPRRGQRRRPLLAQRGQPGRAAGGRRRRPRREGLRLPPQQRIRRGAVGPTTQARPIQSSPSVAPISPGGTDSVFVGTGDAGNPTVGRLPGHHEHRRRPVVRPGDQPGHRLGGPLGRLRLPDGGQLRRGLRRGGRITRPEHVRAGRRQRRSAGWVPVVPG